MADISRSPLGPLLQKTWPISRFVGYRPPGHDMSQVDGASKYPYNKPRYIVHSFVGAFVGIALIALTARNEHYSARGVPIVVGSFGAEAVLLFGSWQSPLAMPGPVLVGNTISAIVGVAVTKGFRQYASFVPGSVFGLEWACASVSMATALAVMQALGVMHPPGGATALLAGVLPQIIQQGWYYVAVIASSSAISLAWALIINNIFGRRYPENWLLPLQPWQPAPPSNQQQLEQALSSLQSALDSALTHSDKEADEGSPTPMMSSRALDEAQYKLDTLRDKLSRRRGATDGDAV